MDVVQRIYRLSRSLICLRLIVHASRFDLLEEPGPGGARVSEAVLQSLLLGAQMYRQQHDPRIPLYTLLLLYFDRIGWSVEEIACSLPE